MKQYYLVDIRRKEFRQFENLDEAVTEYLMTSLLVRASESLVIECDTLAQAKSLLASGFIDARHGGLILNAIGRRLGRVETP
jgi:hypothetical protein